MTKSINPRQPVRFSTFEDITTYLDSLGLFRMLPGLERIIVVLNRLNLRRPPFIVAQVVGTNGKSSTSTMLASLGSAHGLKTGLGTSPHFVSIRERIKINGRLLPEQTWLDCANKLMDAGGDELSYFEFIVALTMVAFAAEGVQLAVMETGLGGSWDATTALMADLVVFTPISLDHTQVLGESIVEIAKDKAGAIRDGKPSITARQSPEAMAEIISEAERRASRLYLVDDAPAGQDIPQHSSFCRVNLSVSEMPGGRKMTLTGNYQRQNAATAMAAWRFISYSFLENEQPLSDPQHLAQVMSAPDISATEVEGLCTAWIPGRMHLIAPEAVDEFFSGEQNSVNSPSSKCSNPVFLLDGAHNCHGLSALGLALAKKGIAPLATIFSCLEDKKPEQMAAHLRALSTGPIFIPPITDNPRAMPPEKLALLIGLNAHPTKSLSEAVRLAREHLSNYAPAGQRLPLLGDAANTSPLHDVILICGSLYLLGEFYAMFPQILGNS